MRGTVAKRLRKLVIEANQQREQDKKVGKQVNPRPYDYRATKRLYKKTNKG